MMQQIHIQYHQTKIGELILGAFDQKLCLLDFRYRKKRTTIDHRIKRELEADFIEQSDAVTNTAKQQIDAYLAGNRRLFNIPLLMTGSDFQKQVWNKLMEVTYGTTCSYAQLAKQMHHEKAVRAVANANGANAIALIIPCHRIIGSNGQLTGYAGGLAAKQYLLHLEQGYATLV